MFSSPYMIIFDLYLTAPSSFPDENLWEKNNVRSLKKIGPLLEFYKLSKLIQPTEPFSIYIMKSVAQHSLEIS